MYVRMTKPRDYWDNALESEIHMQPVLAVIVEDNAPVETGILDADGVMIGRLPDRGPMGFHKPEGR